MRVLDPTLFPTLPPLMWGDIIGTHSFWLRRDRHEIALFLLSPHCLYMWGSLCFWKKQRNKAIPARSDLLTSGYVHTLWKCRLKTPIFYCAAYFKYYGTLTFYIPAVIINWKLSHVWLFSSNKKGSHIKENKQASRRAKYSIVLILIINQGHRQFILVSVAEANLLGNPTGHVCSHVSWHITTLGWEKSE